MGFEKQYKLKPILFVFLIVILLFINNSNLLPQNGINLTKVTYYELNSAPNNYFGKTVAFKAYYKGIFPSYSKNFPNNTYQRVLLLVPGIEIPYMKHNIYVSKQVLSTLNRKPKMDEEITLIGMCNSISGRGIENNEHFILVNQISFVDQKAFKPNYYYNQYAFIPQKPEDIVEYVDNSVSDENHTEKRQIVRTASTVQPKSNTEKIVVNGYRVEQDKKGNPNGDVNISLSGLDKDNKLVEKAEISEVKVINCQNSDGYPQKAKARVKYDIEITREPILAVINLDTTRSMTENDPKNLRITAAKKFIMRLRNDKDQASIMHFDTQCQKSNGLVASETIQDFCSDKNLLLDAIKATKNGGSKFSAGNTPLWDSCYDAVKKLSTVKSPERILIVLSDGEDNFSIYWKPNDVIAEAKKHNVKIYTIGLEKFADDNNLQYIAKETGGMYKKANKADELEKFFYDFFNDVSAKGEVQLNFDPPPAKGSTIMGTLNLTVDGKKHPVDFNVKM